MKPRVVALWSAGLTVFGMVACADESLAPLRRSDPNPDGRAPRPLRDAADDVDADLDATASSSSGSSSGASSSSGSSSGDNDAAVEPGLCAVAERFGLSQPVPGLESVSTASEFAITPDERVIVWTQPGELGVEVHTASRLSESASFGASVVVAPAAGFTAPRGLSLSEDGLHLIVIANDGSALGELVRPDRGAAFAPEVQTAPFVDVEPDAGADNGPLLAVALGARSQLLAIGRVRPDAPNYSVLVADRIGDTAWPLPSPRTEAALSTAGGLKWVTGVSHDGLTLFVRHADGSLFAINRPNLGGTFEPDYARPLVAAHAAMPNAACDRLYVLEAGSLRVRPQALE